MDVAKLLTRVARGHPGSYWVVKPGQGFASLSSVQGANVAARGVEGKKDK